MSDEYAAAIREQIDAMRDLGRKVEALGAELRASRAHNAKAVGKAVAKGINHASTSAKRARA